MASVACTNPECDANGTPIDNPFGFPADVIVCGVCGGPVTEEETGE